MIELAKVGVPQVAERLVVLGAMAVTVEVSVPSTFSSGVASVSWKSTVKVMTVAEPGRAFVSTLMLTKLPV